MPAAGLGQRFAASATGLPSVAGAEKSPEAGPSKIERLIHGRPAFLRAIDLFVRRKDVSQVILAVNPDTIQDFQFKWGDQLGLLGVFVIPGGTRERWETVRLALEHVAEGCTHIAVHDAARPLASATLIDRIFLAAERYDAVVPGLPVASTLKRVEEVDAPAAERDYIDDILSPPESGAASSKELRVIETVPRRDLYEVQTPQVFSLNLLRRGYDLIGSGQLDPAGITDDASLIEALGRTVRIVEGEPTNLKITRAGDMELAEALATARDAASAKQAAAKKLFRLDDEL